MSTEQDSKIWKTHAVYDTYEQALDVKTTLLVENELVKIKRCGKGGRQYKIKVWNIPERVIKKKKKSKKT